MVYLPVWSGPVLSRLLFRLRLRTVQWGFCIGGNTAMGDTRVSGVMIEGEIFNEFISLFC